jgi:hypothetical protein
MAPPPPPAPEPKPEPAPEPKPAPEPEPKVAAKPEPTALVRDTEPAPARLVTIYRGPTKPPERIRVDQPPTEEEGGLGFPGPSDLASAGPPPAAPPPQPPPPGIPQ